MKTEKRLRAQDSKLGWLKRHGLRIVVAARNADVHAVTCSKGYVA